MSVTKESLKRMKQGEKMANHLAAFIESLCHTVNKFLKKQDSKNCPEKAALAEQ